jgi:hypothetical protein
LFQIVEKSTSSLLQLPSHLNRLRFRAPPYLRHVDRTRQTKSHLFDYLFRRASICNRCYPNGYQQFFEAWRFCRIFKAIVVTFNCRFRLVEAHRSFILNICGQSICSPLFPAGPSQQRNNLRTYRALTAVIRSVAPWTRSALPSSRSNTYSNSPQHKRHN